MTKSHGHNIIISLTKFALIKKDIYNIIVIKDSYNIIVI